MIRIMFPVIPCPWSALFDGAPERRLRLGETLFLRGDPIHSLHLLREGQVALVRVLESGTALTLHTTLSGEPVAQASIFADQYHCDATCRTDAVIASMPRDALLRWMQRDDAMMALANASREVQALRSRIEVLRLRRLSDRIDAYLALHGPPAPGGWAGVADWIGVTPAALYRELAKRRTA